MEDGTVTLVGATTENPSFELNAALLSRAQVLIFKPLDEAALEQAARRAPRRSSGRPLPLDAEARAALDRAWPTATAAPRSTWPRRSGARPSRARPSTPSALQDIVQRRAPLYDKAQRGPLQPDLARCTSRCAAPTPTRRSTISRACSTAARTRSTSPAAWCAWRSRTSAWPTRRRWCSRHRRQGRLRLPRLARGRAGARRRRRSISRPRPNRTPPTSPTRRRMRGAPRSTAR